MFEQMVRWHFVLLAAFLVQPHPPALALRLQPASVARNLLGGPEFELADP